MFKTRISNWIKKRKKIRSLKKEQDEVIRGLGAEILLSMFVKNPVSKRHHMNETNALIRRRDEIQLELKSLMNK